MASTYATPGVGDSGARQKEHFGRNVVSAANYHSAEARQAPSGPPDTKLVSKSAVAHLSGAIAAEQNDDYPVVASLNARWRVIVCKNSIQWVLQRRRGVSNHWRGYWFCRTREALIRGAREHAGEIAGEALVILLRLPERIGGAP